MQVLIPAISIHIPRCVTRQGLSPVRRINVSIHRRTCTREDLGMADCCKKRRESEQGFQTFILRRSNNEDTRIQYQLDRSLIPIALSVRLLGKGCRSGWLEPKLKNKPHQDTNRNSTWWMNLKFRDCRRIRLDRVSRALRVCCLISMQKNAFFKGGTGCLVKAISGGFARTALPKEASCLC